MLKTIFFFLLTNVLVLVTITIIITLLTSVLWINIWGYYSWSDSLLWILIFAWVVWFTWAFISLFISKWMAKKMHNIVLINNENLHSLSEKERRVYTLIQDISNKNGIKMPEVWVYESEEANAFATWATKNSSLVAVSTWLLNKMNQDEIDWVIAHEMAHILNWDMITMTLLQWVINTFVVFISRIIASLVEQFFSSNQEESSSPSWIYYVASIVLDIIFSILASILVMWFSRHREFRADEWSAKLVWKDKMIAALQKLQQIYELNTTTDWSSMATMKISSKDKWWIMSLLASHPDLSKRIENLKNFNY